MSYSLACVIVRETTDAVLIRDVRDDREHWIPFSQITRIVRNVPPHAPLGRLLQSVDDEPTGTVTPRCTSLVVMTEWIAQQKGLQ